jgi:phosphohistidine swiveling domain-containing protein
MPENQLERLNAFINESATIYEKAGAIIVAPAHKAVMYDEDGNVILAASGEKAIGVILSSTSDPIEKDAPVHILIRAIGLLEAAEAIKKGAYVTIDATGRGTVAKSGEAIFGRAFTSVAAEGECVQVQINPMGKA